MMFKGGENETLAPTNICRPAKASLSLSNEIEARAGSRRKMSSRFSFPILSRRDIVAILAELQIANISENDLINPTLDLDFVLYSTLLGFLDSLRDDHGQVDFGALEHLENPELHIDFVRIMNLCNKIKKVVGSSHSYKSKHWAHGMASLNQKVNLIGVVVEFGVPKQSKETVTDFMFQSHLLLTKCLVMIVPINRMLVAASRPELPVTKGSNFARKDRSLLNSSYLYDNLTKTIFLQPLSPLPVTVAPAPLPSLLPQSLPWILISNRSRSRNESNKDSGSFKVSACLTIVTL
ncbi:hypothetical protein HHK36_004717 [Tetracentron sinense]|uniref:Kinetochore protein Nuf2 N-terminal domain-containing protein n=1 Tax=Tetracentron sinense TaxID=13715 RepID=A0A834ZK02_TETSI|nr:hypothetical protein HHK36_004717 [Tetracentron sinense]